MWRSEFSKTFIEMNVLQLKLHLDKYLQNSDIRYGIFAFKSNESDESIFDKIQSISKDARISNIVKCYFFNDS